MGAPRHLGGGRMCQGGTQAFGGDPRVLGGGLGVGGSRCWGTHPGIWGGTEVFGGDPGIWGTQPSGGGDPGIWGGGFRFWGDPGIRTIPPPLILPPGDPGNLGGGPVLPLPPPPNLSPGGDGGHPGVRVVINPLNDRVGVRPRPGGAGATRPPPVKASPYSHPNIWVPSQTPESF